MTQINYDEVLEYVKEQYKDSDWLATLTPFDFFADGMEYAMKQMKDKGQEDILEGSALGGTHYFYTATIGPTVVENYFPSKEEAETSRDANEEILNFFKELFKCEVSEIIERQGKIEEAYSILPNGEKFTSSDVQKLFLA